MSEKNIETHSREDLAAMREREEGKTDWQRLANMDDESIDTSDIPELNDPFWNDVTPVLPEPKERISIRLDREVLDYFRKGGPGYQTRMNAVLKSFVRAQGKGETKS